MQFCLSSPLSHAITANSNNSNSASRLFFFPLHRIRWTQGSTHFNFLHPETREKITYPVGHDRLIPVGMGPTNTCQYETEGSFFFFKWKE